ncbi:MAG: hypothetical protein J4F33_09440 [Alphaproteobacteria bacterium]|nr:hypothetical protein [Alphaproteobacteria bacterium]
MSPELIAILAVGAALAGVVLTGLRGVRADLGRRIDKLEERVAAVERGQAELRERMAKLEGLLEGLREAISGRRSEAAE